MPSRKSEPKKDLTVREAGRLGGKKTAQTHGHEFYSEIGHKGGQKVKDLINKAEQQEKK